MTKVYYPPDSPNLVRFPVYAAPLFIGLVSGIKIVAVGELFLGEPMAIAYFLSRLHGARLTNQERWFGVLAVSWSLAQLLSDIVNNTAPLDLVKGVLAPLVFAFTTLGMIIYFRKSFARMPSFLIGVSAAACINIFTLPTHYFVEYNKWKWGAGIIVLSLLLLYYSFFKRNKSNQFLMLGLLGFLLISLHNNARILGVLPVLAGIAYFIFVNSRTSFFLRFFLGRRKLLKALAVAVPFVVLLNYSASAVFSYEPVLRLFPEDVAEKYRSQASNPYGMLFAGRTEFLISTRAFLDKPVLGHGSWAIDDGTYIPDYLRLRYLYGVDEFQWREASYSSRLIPAHSFLMGSLVWSGMLGGVFWIYVFYISARAFLRNLAYLPVYFYNGFFFLLWDILFSPFGALTRWSSALILAPLLAYVYIMQRQIHESKLKRFSP